MFMKFYVADVWIMFVFFSLFFFSLAFNCCSETYALKATEKYHHHHNRQQYHLIFAFEMCVRYYQNAGILIIFTSFCTANKIFPPVNTFIFLCYHDDGLTFIAILYAISVDNVAFSFSNIFVFVSFSYSEP